MQEVSMKIENKDLKSEVLKEMSEKLEVSIAYISETNCFFEEIIQETQAKMQKLFEEKINRRIKYWKSEIEQEEKHMHNDDVLNQFYARINELKELLSSIQNHSQHSNLETPNKK